MPATDAAIQEEMRTVMGVANPTEPFTYAKWAAERVNDANDVSRKLSKLWTEKLDPDERSDLLGMVSRVMSVEGEHTQQQRVLLQKLRERLGLVTR
jgi:hypothetical protein